MRICTFEGCERKHGAKGLCKVHYNMWKIEGVVRPIGLAGGWKRGNRKEGIIRLCSIEGCGKKHEAKGLCKHHWSRQHYNRQNSIPRARNNGKICSVAECKDFAKSQGYCQKHYYRWRTNGTTDLIPRHIARKECAHEGCDTKKHNGGYCYHHYRVIVLKIECKPRGGHNKKPRVKCDVDNCDSFARVKGWCDKHYGRFRRNGDPLTCYRRPRKSEYVSLDNILKNKGTYSKLDDEEVLRENFSDIYNDMDRENHY
jgi:hypothetical protein